MSSTAWTIAKLAPITLLLLIEGCKSEADTKIVTVAARPVMSALVQPASRQESAYTGVVAARTESNLGFRVSGKIVERRVDPGDRVARGDTLLVLDIEDFELALRAANNRVRAAQAQLRQARDDQGRYSRLSASGSISKQTLDQATTALRIAESDVATATSEARQVENRRSYSTLTADGDGIITDVQAERGQVVAEGQIVAKLAHDGAREAIINIPETQRALASNDAQAFPLGDPEQAVPAKLRELSAAADPVTRTYRARYILEGNSARFPIGSTITVRLLNAGQEGYTRVPIGALYDSGKGAGVWLIGEAGSINFTAVKVAKLGQEYAVLQSGVSPGQQVVALGAHLLHEGDKVRPLPAPGDELQRSNAQTSSRIIDAQANAQARSE